MLLLLPLLAFIFASLIITAGALALSPGGATTIERRLGELGGGAEKAPVSEAGYNRSVLEAFKRIGAAAPKR